MNEINNYDNYLEDFYIYGNDRSYFDKSDAYEEELFVTDFEETFAIKSFAIDFEVNINDETLCDMREKLTASLSTIGAKLVSLKAANNRVVIEFNFPDNMNSNKVKSLLIKELSSD